MIEIVECGQTGQLGEFVCNEPNGHAGPHYQRDKSGIVAWSHSDQWKEISAISEARRTRSARDYAYRLANGLCTICATPTLPGDKSICIPCIRYQRNRYRLKVRAGRCWWCDEVAEEGTSCCGAHQGRENTRMRRSL